ncbi:hypothetical protein LCGC14_3062940 [marine sediment metagenome]|uniref:Uncharacterized protein n=1 Tax=marine sediment metagenome TaxID=412755 RepID=A0A0F8Z935_9ZZZZ
MSLAVTGRLDFVDEKNKESNTVIRIPTGFALSDMNLFLQTAAQALADISGCQVTGASVTIGLTLPGGLRTVASIASDIARKAFLQYRTVVSGFFNKMQIPTLKETLTVGSSDDIDQADPAVAALLSAHVNGIPVTGPATVSFGNDRIMLNDAISIAVEHHMKKK